MKLYDILSSEAIRACGDRVRIRVRIRVIVFTTCVSFFLSFTRHGITWEEEYEALIYLLFTHWTGYLQRATKEF